MHPICTCTLLIGGLNQTWRAQCTLQCLASLLAVPQCRLCAHPQHFCTAWSWLYSTPGPVQTHSVQAPQAFAPKLEKPLLLTNPDVATKNVQLATNAGSSMEGTCRWCWPCKQYTADASAAAYRLI